MKICTVIYEFLCAYRWMDQPLWEAVHRDMGALEMGISCHILCLV